MDVRWLDDDEQATWRTFLAATHLLMDRLDRELQAGVGMPHAYYEILVRLSEAPGRAMRMSDLAERCHSSRSRLSHAVRRLEDDGWVRRGAVEADRRGAVAILTDAGREALEAAAPCRGRPPAPLRPARPRPARGVGRDQPGALRPPGGRFAGQVTPG